MLTAGLFSEIQLPEGSPPASPSRHRVISLGVWSTCAPRWSQVSLGKFAAFVAKEPVASNPSQVLFSLVTEGYSGGTSEPAEEMEKGVKVKEFMPVPGNR